MLQIVNSAYLRLYKGSLDKYDVAPLNASETLLTSPYYNSSLSNVLYTFGFTGKVDGPATTAVITALLKLNDRNVFLMDWQEEASSTESLGDWGRQLSYALHAAPNSCIYGRKLGQALSRMSENAFDLDKTHLIAHSLGAHLFGYTGKYLISQGKTLPRITGLDPARPLFDQPRLLDPLASDCANFVDIIHTSPGAYGINSSNGHLDIYANFGFFINPTDSNVQPGCPVGKYAMFSEEDLCSHNRVWMFQIEAWFSYHSLQASKADNYSQWVAVGNSTDVVYLGDDTDKNARGIYFMTTNPQPPYGRGPAGLYP